MLLEGHIVADYFTYDYLTDKEVIPLSRNMACSKRTEMGTNERIGSLRKTGKV